MADIRYSSPGHFLLFQVFVLRYLEYIQEESDDYYNIEWIVFKLEAITKWFLKEVLFKSLLFK